MDEPKKQEPQPAPPASPQHFAGMTAFLILLMLILLGVIFAAFSWVVFKREGAINQNMLYLYIGFFALLAALVMFAIFSTATAEVWGTKAGINFRMVGTPAAFFIFFVVFWKMAPGPETRTVQVILMHGGQQLGGEFTIIPTIGGVDGGPRKSQNGQITLQIPGYVGQIDAIELKKPGYELKSKPPFKLEDKVLKLEVTKTDDVPPADPNTRRDPTAVFKEFPTEDEVKVEGQNVIEECGLFYRNVTDHKLTLWIADCSRHYRIKKAKESGAQAWMHFPFLPSKKFEYYQKFSDSTGWYCFAVVDENGAMHALQPSARRNLCKNKITKMTVSSPQDGVFEVAWEVGDEKDKPRGHDK